MRHTSLTFAFLHTYDIVFFTNDSFSPHPRFPISDIYSFLFFSNGLSYFLLRAKSSRHERDRNARSAKREVQQEMHHVRVGVSRPFTYDSFTVLPRRRHPNDSPFFAAWISRFLIARETKKNPWRRATNDRKNIAILIVHLTLCSFFLSPIIFFSLFFFLSLFSQTKWRKTQPCVRGFNIFRETATWKNSRERLTSPSFYTGCPWFPFI